MRARHSELNNYPERDSKHVENVPKDNVTGFDCSERKIDDFIAAFGDSMPEFDVTYEDVNDFINTFDDLNKSNDSTPVFNFTNENRAYDLMQPMNIQGELNLYPVETLSDQINIIDEHDDGSINPTSAKRKTSTLFQSAAKKQKKSVNITSQQIESPKVNKKEARLSDTNLFNAKGNSQPINDTIKINNYSDIILQFDTKNLTKQGYIEFNKGNIDTIYKHFYNLNYKSKLPDSDKKINKILLIGNKTIGKRILISFNKEYIDSYMNFVISIIKKQAFTIEYLERLKNKVNELKGCEKNYNVARKKNGSVNNLV